MADASSYSIRRLGTVRRNGITSPVTGSVNAVIKFDSVESEHCVYNELVAVRLAQTLHAPLADGVLTVAGAGHAFASLELGAPGLPLPDVPDSHHGRVAKLYPEAVAGLVAFDLWIGNADQARNFKASLVTPHVPVFRGSDHCHALLAIESSPAHSLQRLKTGDQIVDLQPFYGRVRLGPLAHFVGSGCRANPNSSARTPIYARCARPSTTHDPSSGSLRHADRGQALCYWRSAAKLTRVGRSSERCKGGANPFRSGVDHCNLVRKLIENSGGKLIFL